MTWLFELFGNWFKDYTKQLIDDIVTSMFNDICSFVFGLLDNFWDFSLVNAFLNFAVVINALVMVIACLILCFDIAEEQQAINWRQVIGNLFKAGLFAMFSRYIGLMTLTVSNLIINALPIQVELNSVSYYLSGLVPSSGIAMALIWSLIMIIAVIAFAVMCVNRNASMMILALSAPLYVADIVRGDTAKIGDWLRQVIAVSFTFVFQYIMFYLFVAGIGSVSSEGPIVALTALVGMFAVPKVLQKYGYSTGVTGALSSAGNLISQGISMVAK